MKISEINAEARKNGLSYGQYMAQKHMEENKELLLPEENPTEEQSEQSEEPKEETEKESKKKQELEQHLCPICGKLPWESKGESSASIYCSLFEHLVCMKHCGHCKYYDTTLAQPRCSHGREQSKEFTPKVIDGRKELVYHFRLRNALTKEEARELRDSDEKFQSIIIKDMSQYHIRMIHNHDDMILCQFLEKIREIERQKREAMNEIKKENE